MALSLTERRREVAMELTHEVLGSETWLTQLLAKLEAVFAKHSIDIAAFEAIINSRKYNAQNVHSVDKMNTEFKSNPLEI